MSRARFASAIGLAALLAAATAGAEKIRTHFDADSAGRSPAFFDLAVWGAPGEAHWLVLGDVNPPSTPNKVIQTLDKRPADSIAVALRRTYVYRDGDISVGVRRGNGQAGLVFRAAGKTDFLLLLVDVASGKAVLSSYRGGKATEIGQGKADVDREWSILSVISSGPSISARWNGKPLLQGADPLPVEGRVGLATAGAGQASFDELVFDGTPPAPPASAER